MQKLTSGFDLTPPIHNLVALGLVQTYTDQPYLSMLRPTNIQSTLPLIGDLQRFLTVFPNHGPPLCKGSEQMIAKTITNTDILFGSFPMTCKHGDTNPQYKTTEIRRQFQTCPVTVRIVYWVIIAPWVCLISCMTSTFYFFRFVDCSCVPVITVCCLQWMCEWYHSTTHTVELIYMHSHFSHLCNAWCPISKILTVPQLSTATIEPLCKEATWMMGFCRE